MADYVNPKELLQEAVQLAKRKSELPVRDLLLRGALAGAFLGYATSLAILVTSQGLPPIAGAILFPVGFVILALLGLELATGNFALLPAGMMGGMVRFSKLLRNFCWVYAGNMAGSILYAALFYLAITNCGASSSGSIGDLLKQAAQRKTLAYAALGPSGWAAALVRGVLCNWMVTIGAMLALVSRSTAGKIAAMWLPIMTFFALGFEHSVVNMFVVPSGMMFGAPVTVGQWVFWNLLPVTIGNLIAGALFTGIALYVTYPTVGVASVAQAQLPTSVQAEQSAAFASVAGANSM